uniref:beta-N-acetylhexosaminidase n=1 Tax=mine drainage metagenome TaxID=410659 RepID=E6Q0X8_9ZZZZ
MRGYGGYVLFARNLPSLERARALTDALRALRPDDPTPLIAIDQEGGRVARLREGLAPMPSMMAVGAADDLDLARKLGEQMAHDLRRMGMNLDFAPVLDLAIDHASTVIGTRSFGDNPERVADLAGAFASGMGRRGIVPTFKHFPGHGSTAVDSHVALPTISLPTAVLHLRDLAPFRDLLPHARGAMVAHVVVESVDRENPATLSEAVMKTLLRESCSFNGVAFTDDLEMGALDRFGTIPQRAAAAIRSGADCALICERLGDALPAAGEIAALISRGEMREWRLREAGMRMRMLRATLSAPIPLEAPGPFPEVGVTIAARAVARVRGNPRVRANESILVRFGVAGDLGSAALGAIDAPALHPGDPTSVDRVLAALESSGRRPVLLSYRTHLDAAARNAIRLIVERFPESILVSTMEPFDIEAVPFVEHAICCFGEDELHLHACAAALFSGAPTNGKVPVALTRG